MSEGSFRYGSPDIAADYCASRDDSSDERPVAHHRPRSEDDALLTHHEHLTHDVANSVPHEGAPSISHPDPNSPADDNMSLYIQTSTPPHLSLGRHVDTGVRTTESSDSPDKVIHTDLNLKPLPKSPTSSKLGSFFGWGLATPSTPEFSEKGFSPLPSPFSPRVNTSTNASSVSSRPPQSANIRPAADGNPLGYCEAYLHTPPATAPPSPIQIEEMEDELKVISAELAASIRREMDLEDLVDRLQEQVHNPQTASKRTSDYFSDSSYSSAKLSDYDHGKEEIAQIQRRADQEKASIRLELTTKLQDERSKRTVLDQQIKVLSQKASQIDLAQIHSRDVSSRVKELEATCEDLRRRLSEERRSKDNFGDLLAALKGELQNAANERDNLRDEIVPQLRARVEGLEAQAMENERLTYESTKMQRELQSLQTENSSLRGNGPSVRMSRSSSVAGSVFRLQQAPLSRSNTTRQAESREALAERLKDVEAQRDALHSALKNLLERQEFQNRENEKKIRILETQRDRLLSGSPKKAGYEREVSNLRQEINALRRRAEEALEQKWQVEKGLAGLKMDLDRAEEEVASLRSLLRENDILIPSTLPRGGGGSDSVDFGPPVSSASLERAYRDLQASYRHAVEKIKDLELGLQDDSSDERTRLALERLEHSLASAVSERDIARQDMSSFEGKIQSLEAAQRSHLDGERNLADQLHESARRVEELAQQVRSQLATNAELRTRLNDTVARGDAEQRNNKEKITDMQSRLHALEVQLVAVQGASEDRIARHEEEVAALKEAHNTQLQRLSAGTGGLRSPRQFPGGKGPISPLFAGANGGKPPLLGRRPGGLLRSASNPSSEAEREQEQLVQIQTLRGKVDELERALATADTEMQEVVARMQTAQIEVLALQEERENAVRQTRKLQRALEEEQARVPK